MSRAIISKVSPAEYQVERMTEHDLLDVVSIEESCGLSLWGWDGYYSELRREESVMLVAACDHSERASSRRIIGFIAARISADELHINNIGIVDEMRRQGIGSRLLVEALLFGARAGCLRAVLEVRASNLSAKFLYERHGFNVAGQRSNYYKNPVEDALLMAAELGGQLDNL